MLARLCNAAYALLQNRPLVFGLLLGAGATAVGVLAGPLPEVALLAATLGWLGWEGRPHLLFALGFHGAAARVAGTLARDAGPSLRGDVHRLTQAAAYLTLGEVDRAKEALAGVEPARLPARGRFVHFLNLSALFCRLGDGESALTMVEASQAEAAALHPGWRGLPAVNRSAALCELGDYDGAAACLEAVGAAHLPAGAHSYYYNNLAWALAMGTGDKQRAMRWARRAVALRGRDPGCLGTLGVTMALAGCEPREALPFLRRALERRERRSPHGQAVLLQVTSQLHRLLGEHPEAAALEADLRALPGEIRVPALDLLPPSPGPMALPAAAGA